MSGDMILGCVNRYGPISSKKYVLKVEPSHIAILCPEYAKRAYVAKEVTIRFARVTSLCFTLSLSLSRLTGSPPCL